MESAAPTTTDETRSAAAHGAELTIIGGGIAGLYALYAAKKAGLKAKLYEAGGDVGGTWYWNCYPGARVDIQSYEYSYGSVDKYGKEWTWSERYSGQPELLNYIRKFVEEYDLKGDIETGARLTAAKFDPAVPEWRLLLEDGRRFSSKFLVLATGPLSEPVWPQIPGMADFKGVAVHTGRWPQGGLDVEGKRVAVIGTGSSGAQISPELAKAAERLFLLQRTPAYSVPSRNRRFSEADIASMKSEYDALRLRASQNRSSLGIDVGTQSALEVPEAVREEIYEQRWLAGGLGFTAAFTDLYSNVEANKTAAEFVRKKIRETVKNPATAQRLMPSTLIGCKRLCVDNGYFEMFNRENVELIDLRETPIDRMTTSGIVCGGKEIPLDIVVFATGFDAISGALSKIHIEGREGMILRDQWSDGPGAYLGLGVTGFPNLFLVNGPSSPSGLANMFALSEANTQWIIDCLLYLKRAGHDTIEADAEAQKQWTDQIRVMANASIYVLENSWYMGSNVPGKPRVFVCHMDFPKYIDECRRSKELNYHGFHTQSAAGEHRRG